MKTLIIPLLWGAALIVALFVLWRWARGRPALLTGRWSPRFVRMVAAVLVLLGATADDRTRAQEEPPRPSAAAPDASDALPDVVNKTTVSSWSARDTTRWVQLRPLKGALLSWYGFGTGEPVSGLRRVLPTRVAAAIMRDVEALRTRGKELAFSVAELVETLDLLERGGQFDHWFNAWVWRKSRLVATDDAHGLPGLYARIARHARITDTLLKARARVKPALLPPRAWMSKAGPWRHYRRILGRAVPPILKAAREIYPKTGIGTWATDAVTPLQVARASAPLVRIRANRREILRPGTAFRLTRLDVLKTPGDGAVLVDHAWLGPLTLPAGRTLTAWNLSDLVPDEVRTRVAETVDRALRGDERAQDLLQTSLPLVIGPLRARVRAQPDAKGAPVLRTLAALHDDTAIRPTPPPLIRRGR